MKFDKGQSGNPAGRPVGSKNKTTVQIREKLLQLVEGNFDRLQADLDALDPKDRVNAILGFVQYCVPKMREFSGSLRISEMNDEDLQQLIDRLTVDDRGNDIAIF